MRISIGFRNLEPSDSLKSHVLKRVHARLGRFGAAISAVELRIGDTNGPKGGIDKRCDVSVRGPRVRPSRLAAISGDTYSAVDAAVDRAARAVRRAVERSRGERRGEVPRVAGSEEK